MHFTLYLSVCYKDKIDSAFKGTDNVQIQELRALTTLYANKCNKTSSDIGLYNGQPPKELYSCIDVRADMNR